MKNHSLLFVFAIFGLTACTDTIEYPITYSSTPKMDRYTSIYTKNGKISETKVINDFLKRYGDFYPDIDLVLKDFQNLKATYISPLSVLLSSPNANAADTMSVHEKNGLIYWERKDTLSIFHNSIDDMFMYKPLYYELRKLSDLYIVQRFLECYYLKRNKTDLEMPLTFFYYKYGNQYSNGYYYSGCNNVFKTEYISNFVKNDTILLYEYRLKFLVDN